MANPLTALQDRAGAVVAAVRRRRPAIDHLIRAYTRYTADTGDRLAAAVTYFGFLSFFPLVVLAVSVLGFVLANSDTAIEEVERQFAAFAPGLASQLPLRQIVAAREGTGVVGLVGLLYAGLGWVDALREAIRTIWHHNVQAGNIIVRKIIDVTILAGLGLTLAVSVAVSGLVTTATTWLLASVGLAGAPGAALLLRLVGLALVLLVDVAVFLYLFIRLPRLAIPWRRVAKGALFAAVGFEVLKYVGAFYVRHTTDNPVYGAFAVVVGLLIWINLASRFLLFAAAWTVTAPYDTDVAPSGTSGPEEAAKAGVPKEFVDRDGDCVPALQEDGAPTPLRAALQGKAGVGFGHAGPGERPAENAPAQRAADARVPAASTLPHERAVRTAGGVGAAVLVAGVLGAVVLGARSLRDLVRG